MDNHSHPSPEKQSGDISRKSFKKIYSGTFSLMMGTLFSRALGFIREILAAKFVGGGHKMDVFVLAFRIPNLVRGILGEKASESAFLPIYKTLTSQGKKEEADSVSADTLKILLLFLMGFCVLAFIFAPFLVTLMGKGFKEFYLDDGTNKFTSSIRMTRLLLPSIVMVGFFSFLGAKMLAREQFAAYSSAPAIANVVTIATIVITFPLYGYYCLAFGVLAGALSECIFFWLFTGDRTKILGSKLGIHFSDPYLKQAGQLWIPITFGSVLEKVGTFIETYMASFLGKGAVSALYYANLITLLFFSVFGLSFNRSVIPYLTTQNAQQNHTEFRRVLLMGIRINIVLLLPISVFIIFMREPLVQLFFERGRFDADATAKTA
jgi:putative peptidoglycan lipid II flippase